MSKKQGEYELKPLMNNQRRGAKRIRNEANRNREGGRRPYEYKTPPHVLRER